jgi:glyoxylase I family protein
MGSEPAERVLGIGGFFFKSAAPSVVAEWYVEHLGVLPPPTSSGGAVWEQEAGPTVFAPFGSDDADSPYLGAAGWGINFRVVDLDAMVAQLRSDGITVEVDPETYPIGRFAQLYDPEGNAVQLWQPA